MELRAADDITVLQNAGNEPHITTAGFYPFTYHIHNTGESAMTVTITDAEPNGVTSAWLVNGNPYPEGSPIVLAAGSNTPITLQLTVGTSVHATYSFNINQ